MKLKKSQRRMITITFLIIIICVIIYCFNIFNIKNLINGISVEKNNTENEKTVTMNGKDIKLPNEFEKSNISILKNDKIIQYTKNEATDNTKTVSEIIVKTDKEINDIFNEYTKLYSNPMTYETDNTKTIITGNAENLIKIIISKNEYKIKLESR